VSFLDYLYWPVKKYREFRSQIESIPAYSICNVDNINGECQLLIIINGTGKTRPFFPHEIANDDLFLSQFSSKDMRIILCLCIEEQNKPRYTIISHKISSEGNDIICLKDRASNRIQDFSVTELSSNKEILKQCSSEDAFRIGYLKGLSDGLKQ